MITYTPPVANNLPIKTLVAWQQPTNTSIAAPLKLYGIMQQSCIYVYVEYTQM